MSTDTLSNVDNAEISKFSAIAQKWWDRTGPMKSLHVVNDIRVKFMTKSKDLTGLNTLDVGCGGGILTESFAKLGANVTGVDMAETPLEVAKLHAKKSGLDIQYQHRTAENMVEDCAGTFDIITCLEVLEHVPDPEAVVKACVKLLRPGGQVYFSTINRTFKAFICAIIGAEYILHLLPKGTHQYKKLIRPSELKQWSAGCGLKLVAQTGIDYNPLTKQFKEKANADINYIQHYSL